tara:strand:+ start:1523 stop:1729 length:207 start_codon:yes stop_codon:yes gene_type:complete
MYEQKISYKKWDEHVYRQSSPIVQQIRNLIKNKNKKNKVVPNCDEEDDKEYFVKNLDSGIFEKIEKAQ